MKKLIYSAALFAATMIGFTSCDKDDEANVKDRAVGDCTVTMSYWMYDGAQLSEYTKKSMTPPLAKLSAPAKACRCNPMVMPSAL